MVNQLNQHSLHLFHFIYNKILNKAVDNPTNPVPQPNSNTFLFSKYVDKLYSKYFDKTIDFQIINYTPSHTFKAVP